MRNKAIFAIPAALMTNQTTGSYAPRIVRIGRFVDRNYSGCNREPLRLGIDAANFSNSAPRQVQFGMTLNF